jgi:hypothetical protein
MGFILSIHIYQMINYSSISSEFDQVNEIYPVQKLVLLTLSSVSSSFINDSRKCPVPLCSVAHITKLFLECETWYFILIWGRIFRISEKSFLKSYETGSRRILGKRTFVMRTFIQSTVQCTLRKKM